MSNLPVESSGLGEEIDSLLIVTAFQVEDDWHAWYAKNVNAVDGEFTQGRRLRLEGIIKYPTDPRLRKNSAAAVRTVLMERYNRILALMEKQGIRHSESPTFQLTGVLVNYLDPPKQTLLEQMARVEFVFFRSDKDVVQ